MTGVRGSPATGGETATRWQGLSGGHPAARTISAVSTDASGSAHQHVTQASSVLQQRADGHVLVGGEDEDLPPFAVLCGGCGGWDAYGL